MMIARRDLIATVLFTVLSVAPAMTNRLHAAQWQVPVAGNAFRIEPAPGGNNLRRTGELTWGDSQDVYAVFVHVDRPANLTIAIEARLPQGQSILETRVSQQTDMAKSSHPQPQKAGKHVSQHTFLTKLNGAEYAEYAIGTLEVSEAGYVRLEFQGNMRSDALFAEIRNVIIKSDTSELKIDFVRNNDGSMFYWGRRGPSVHLTYSLPRDQKIQYGYSEITVPVGKDPIGSYFMANGFAEGYFGIQVNGPAERRVLFSVWSPFQTDNPRDIPEEQRIVALAKGPDVRIGEFGNEGSGGQSFLVYPWQAGTTYSFLTEVKPSGEGQTVYTSWFGDKQKNEWRLIASFRRPKTDTHLRGFHSFLESFDPSFGHIEREALYGNVWVRNTEGNWYVCDKAKFSVDATGGGRHRLDFSGGAVGKSFFMRNCGFFSGTVKAGEIFTRDATADQQPQIDFKTLPRQ